MSDKIKDKAYDCVRPIVENLGYELVDVEYLKLVDGMNLVVTIDKEGGITINDCERVHNAIDALLDVCNPTNDKPYILSVSSPGLDRPLKTNKELEKNIGKMVDLSCYTSQNGKKQFEGELFAFNETSISLKTKDSIVSFDRNQIAKIVLHLEF